ncbi:uncharacterized protein LOC128198852 [Bicyclus anynana]|uniref:Uncharacterized protein LOC128198852 n=1 Tax=Bicyclus anynana TaxID=110368 RepID=A0ABM3LSZ8_BICAN|nr:uncharacterized protein LOC128198852 [Bicyclus anynana]
MMARPMLTRRAAAMEQQLQLKNALLEIKSLKQLNSDLLKEHDDNEEELRNIITKNSQLKSELAELHSTHSMVLEERSQLQEAVDTFNQCIRTYDEALAKISMLEDELNSAHKTIDDLQSQLQQFETQNTNNLYNELLASSTSVPAPMLCIDLTCDSPCATKTLAMPQSRYNLFNSHNKIKKYIKIKKFMKKTQKLIKFHSTNKKNLALRKERSLLIKKVNTYCSLLENSREKYENETQSLQHELNQMENNLQEITAKYELSQSQIHDQIIVAEELLALGTYNMARFESLSNKCQCSNQVPSVTQDCSSVLSNSGYIDLSQNVQCNNNVIPIPSTSDKNLSSHSFNLPKKAQKKTLIISDKLGKDFGSIMSQYLNHSVTNKCFPGASFNYLINSISTENVVGYSNVILMLGNSLKN